jgi:hemerythrin-like domain-containing protein
MKPIGQLMTEHRLIERMVRLLDKELQSTKKTSNTKTNLISIGVDFRRIYADRTHHGKEEDILFKELSTKRLSAKENQMLERLIQEHIWARQAVTKLFAANSRYIHGDTMAMEEMVYEPEKLVRLYPLHIEKEDKHFLCLLWPTFQRLSSEPFLRSFGNLTENLSMKNIKGWLKK